MKRVSSCLVVLAGLLAVGLNPQHAATESLITVKVPKLRSVRFIDELHGWITGYRNVYYTCDRGRRWVKQSLDPGSVPERDKPLLYDLGFLAWADLHSAFVLNEWGWVAVDGGAGQRRQVTIPEGVETSMETVAFADRKYGWGVGNGGQIFWTSDSGISWHRSPNDEPAEALTAVFVRSRKEVWVGGRGGTLVYTRNGGQTWNKHQETEESNFDIKCIRFYQGGRGWICGMGNFAFKTSDGGRTWSKMTLPERCFPFWRAISFVNETEGWIVGSRDIKGLSQGTILYTRDRGLHWDIQDYNMTEPLVDVQALPNGSAWVVGENGLVLQTTDHGKTWNSIKIE